MLYYIYADRLNRIIELLEKLYEKGDDVNHTLAKVLFELYCVQRGGDAQ